jgi:microcystin-dependent protein
MSEPFIGEIRIVAFNFPPRGYALCNGQILSISQNTALFSLLGVTYGGNGQTTFALPNLQSRVPVHPGQGAGLSPVTLGQVGGNETVTLTQNNLPAHSHLASTTQAAAQSTRPGNQVPASGQAVYGSPPDGSAFAPGFIQNAGGSQPFGIQPPYLGVNFVIALQGIFPSRN